MRLLIERKGLNRAFRGAQKGSPAKGPGTIYAFAPQYSQKRSKNNDLFTNSSREFA
jgi:hypothetical protein